SKDDLLPAVGIEIAGHGRRDEVRVRDGRPDGAGGIREIEGGNAAATVHRDDLELGIVIEVDDGRELFRRIGFLATAGELPARHDPAAAVDHDEAATVMTHEIGWRIRDGDDLHGAVAVE